MIGTVSSLSAVSHLRSCVSVSAGEQKIENNVRIPVKTRESVEFRQMESKKLAS